MMTQNNFAEILKEAQDMGMVDGYIVIHIAGERYRKHEFHISRRKASGKNVDAIDNFPE